MDDLSFGFTKQNNFLGGHIKPTIKTNFLYLFFITISIYFCKTNLYKKYQLHKTQEHNLK